jgi:tungstate transport system substrate-binding protein
VNLFRRVGKGHAAEPTRAHKMARMTLDRRSLLALLAASAVPLAHAAQRKSLADPMLLGVENALLESGLAGQFQQVFGRETGVAVQLVPGYSATLLETLERGEIDAAMTNAPEQEVQLEKQGLAHDRRLVAVGDFVLVGPQEGKGKKAKDPVGILGGHDIAAALAQIAQAQARFVGPTLGSGAYLSTLPLWRAAKVAPAAPWYVEGKTGALAQAGAEGAYTLVERGLWMARGSKPLSLMVDGDPRMATEVHVMRSFRVNHPAAKLFGQWVSGPQGRRVAGSLRGWRAAPT